MIHQYLCHDRVQSGDYKGRGGDLWNASVWLSSRVESKWEVWIEV